MSNEKQWGIALEMYSGDNENSFPDNSDGQHLSWMGRTMKSFWKNYLIESKETEFEKNKFHVIFCPTDKWHRVADLWRNGNPDPDPRSLAGMTTESKDWYREGECPDVRTPTLRLL